MDGFFRDLAVYECRRKKNLIHYYDFLQPWNVYSSHFEVCRGSDMKIGVDKAQRANKQTGREVLQRYRGGTGAAVYIFE